MRLKSKSIAELYGDMIFPEPNTGCWLWSGTYCSKRKHNQYGFIKINGKRKVVHRVSYEEFNGPIPDDMQVCHKCDTPQCCNPKHLFLGTIADNTRDRHLKGRSARGTKSGNSVLNESKVLEIRRLLKDGLTMKAIAQKYKIGKSTVGHIKTGRAWGWLNKGMIDATTTKEINREA